MSNFINPVKSAVAELKELITDAFGRLVAEGKIPAVAIPAFNIEVPANQAHGDFSSNAAMVCAKPLKLPPREIATLLCGALVLEGSHFKKSETAGPGFINFFLSEKWFSKTVKDIITAGNDYGKSSIGNGKKILVEFVSANPTGPMHIGNARGGALGDCLCSVLSAAGFCVSREFYINDAGNQIEKFADSLEARYLQIFNKEHEMPESAYQGEDITEHAKNFADIHGDKYAGENSALRREALVEYALPLNIKKLDDDLSKYRITYDKWFRESTLHESGEVERITELLKKSGYTYEQEGALWFKTTAFGDEKDRVLIRANGVPTYYVPDIAYHYDKLVTRGYDTAVDIWGADHHGYVPRMKAALQALGIDPDRLKVIIMQMVRLVKNGEAYKLSKRSGKAVTLETLLDEIPIDAARFFFNLREANSHFEFDLDLAIEKTSKNPVYYVQYAHARICSIQAKSREEAGVSGELPQTSNLIPPTTEEELALIRHLAAFPDTIELAAADYDPSPLTRYSMELASLFHKFYAQCRIKDAEPDLMNARLALCDAVKITLKNILDMMKIECPEVM
ncbi:MAG: arginine--tRNA ligase [Oscillospiraceae bacterium]|nr:arginine--tRNA ligase [Oscillospiraceae bacterium]